MPAVGQERVEGGVSRFGRFAPISVATPQATPKPRHKKARLPDAGNRAERVAMRRAS